MRMTLLTIFALVGINFSMNAAESVLDIPLKDIDGKKTSLKKLKGSAYLIVNVASKCGQTPQYSGLERLHRKFKDRGLIVVGFPSNDFGEQEPGTEAEIKQFCSSRYQVTFRMFSKVKVRPGKEQHPLYSALTGKQSAKPGQVGWNFEKILVGKDGKVIARFESYVEPDEAEFVQAVEKALAAR